jgi:hypothetical protein
MTAVGIRVMTIALGTCFTPAFRMHAALVPTIVQNDYLNGETIRIDGAQLFGMK